MNHRKESNNETIKTKEVDIQSELAVICKHCGQLIDKVRLIGISLICPLCKKPQNGIPHLE